MKCWAVKLKKGLSFTFFFKFNYNLSTTNNKTAATVKCDNLARLHKTPIEKQCSKMKKHVLCEWPLNGVQASYRIHLITERAMQLKPRERPRESNCWRAKVFGHHTQSPFVESYLTFQSVLLSPHDVNQRVLQRMHVKAIEWTGTILWEEKRRMGIKKTTIMAFLIPFSSAGVSLSSTIEFKLLCFCSSKKLNPVERKSQMKGSRGSRPKYKSNLVLATDLTSRSCG